MALKFADRVKETTSTTGAGTWSLAGAASRFRAFSDVLSDGDTCYYGAEQGADWEVGLGTYAASGNTLARTTILASSNSGDVVDFTAAPTVWIDLPASLISKFPVSDQNTTISGQYTFTNGSLIAGTSSNSNSTLYVNTSNSTTSSIQLQRAGSTKAELFASGISGRVGFLYDNTYPFAIAPISGFTTAQFNVQALSADQMQLYGGRNSNSGRGNDFVLKGGITNDFQAGHLLLRAGEATGTGINGDIKLQSADGLADYVFIEDGSGNVGIATSSPSCKLDLNDDHIRIRNSKTPSSASDTGDAGDIAWDSDYVYVCVATNTWRRAALTSW